MRNHIVATAALLSTCALGVPALAQDAAFGRGVWLTQANCADCHGWMGEGIAEDPRSPRGANLRETGLDAEGLTEIILCGLPGTAMPYFDHRAYTDDRCYGMTAADMGDSKPPISAMPLTKRHAAGLAAFILDEFAGKGEVTLEQCQSLLGADSARCARYAEAAPTEGEAAPGEGGEGNGEGLH